MKFIQLVLILITIFCNEIVVELVLCDDYKNSTLGCSADENTEKEKTHLEEAESDFVNEPESVLLYINNKLDSDPDWNTSNVMNPFFEIHSPPPDQFFV